MCRQSEEKKGKRKSNSSVFYMLLRTFKDGDSCVIGRNEKAHRRLAEQNTGNRGFTLT